MSRIISRAEAWERAYQVFTQVNFNSFDFPTVKQSLLDYMRLYFPEDFNDYIESSEFIALLEIFAYISELYAYRLDLNAHENFITSAQRKDSILRLAKLISYTASRNIPARGLVKMTSISTTERITDSNGLNLANRNINWNDPNNINWKEQFLLVINRVLQQNFGSVSPEERIQVDDVLFELYRLNNNPIPNGVFSYQTTVSGANTSMELVPASLNENGPIERRPDNTSPFSILFGNDGLGDGSDTTGFFLFTKQGTLVKQTTTFDGITPNQIFEINTPNINDVDVWLNNIDPDTTETLNDGSISNGISGEWQEVDLANAQNIIFNTNIRRQKFEIETLDNDEIRLVFGDGEFADIPGGTFDIWFRTTDNNDIVIPKTAVVNNQANFTYSDINGNVQTLRFTYSLVNTLQNAAPSEDIDHIRRVAPSVYYTQDRMVNNRDYNTFMLQDPSILKLRSVNRTFAGDSKWMHWHDPRETYENVRLFGDDGAFYLNDGDIDLTITTGSINDLITDFIEPILSTTDFFTITATRGLQLSRFRTSFNDNFNAAEPSSTANYVPLGERTELSNALLAMTTGNFLHLFYSISFAESGTLVSPWRYESANADTITDITNSTPGVNPSFYPDPLWTGKRGVIFVELVNQAAGTWRINWKTERMILESQEMRFWNTNEGNRVVDYDTFNSVNDKISFLKANLNPNQECLLNSNLDFNVLSQALVKSTNLRDIHRLNVIPTDIDGDGIPDNMDLNDLLNGSWVIRDSNGSQPAAGVKIPLPFPMLYNDFLTVPGLIVVTRNGTPINMSIGSPLVGDYILHDDTTTLGVGLGTGEAATHIELVAAISTDEFRIELRDYVYQAINDDGDFVTQPLTPLIIETWFTEAACPGGSPAIPDYPDNKELGNYRRLKGRQGFNFAWFHQADRFKLINPAATNIIDMYIITRGYFTNVRNWLDEKTTVVPTPPTPLDLRTAYNFLLDNRMISDTVVLHSGLFKILFGSKAIPELQAIFKVIKTPETTLTDNQIKNTIVDTIKTFFDVNLWEFGESFYFTELAAAIHNELQTDIDSVVLVPAASNHQFGDLFVVPAREDEIFAADIAVTEIEIVDRFTPVVLKQNP